MTQPGQDQTTRLQILAAVNAAAAVSTATSAATATAIWGLWRRLNPYDHRAVADFARQAGQLMVASQKSVATAHAASQQVQLRALGINRPVVVTIPDNVRGARVTFGGSQPKVHAKEVTVEYKPTPEPQPATEPTAPPQPERGGVKAAEPQPVQEEKTVERTIPKDDAEATKIFERAAETYRYERSIGAEHDAANAKAEQRIATIVDNNMMLSARLASQQTLMRVAEQDERVIGYRRIIHPEASKGGVCGLCIAAADRVYKVSDLQPIHDRCECTISPVTTEHDPGFTLNYDELERLYAHSAETAPMETIYNKGEAIGTRRALPTSAKALKKTRYQIVHHGELGPVLTRVTGTSVPYASTEPAA
ncbi:hypothetical protein [Mycobacterium sp. TY813]|uniref:hypothetical protein n=1 Tax=Mycobacterium TaxID=1763 RepID=UPI002741B5A3|nr:hypothetical protein [Mycobacterium sp. TY813]MDP7729503.1 hypothetical protein [Mycobacterium sp. TY813]